MQPLSRFVRVAASLSLAGALISVPGGLSAQDAANAAPRAVHDARWQPWLGCWSPTGAVSSAVAATMLCVVPGATPTSVEIVNFSGGAVTDRAVIDPGQPVAKQADECKGSETATWSADGRRVMLRGTFTCARGVTRTETGLMSINADGEWVQAQSINMGGAPPTFYVAHFRDTEMQIEGIRGDTVIERPLLDLAGRRISPPRFGCSGTESVVRDTAQRVVVRSAYACTGGLLRVADARFARVNGEWIRADREPVPFGTPSVRAEAGAQVTTDDVLEVARVVDPSVTEAWITDRNQTFALTGKQLVSLADRGMPSRVIDMMVAISNPSTFTMYGNDARVGVSELAESTDMRRGEQEPRYTTTTTTFDYGMMGIGWMYGANSLYGYNPYSRYGYGNYNNRYGYGYWGDYYNRGGAPPVVIVGPPPAPQPRGRAVYGQGYTRTQPSSGSDMTSRSSRSPWPSGSSTSAGSSSGQSAGSASPRSAPSTTTGGAPSGSSSGSSSSGGARTAKARGGS